MSKALMNLLSNNGFIMCNKSLARQLGLEAAIIVGAICSEHQYWEQRDMLDEDGMFYTTYERLMEEVGLTRHMVSKTVRELEKIGILKTKSKGLPAKKFYMIDYDVILEVMEKDDHKVEVDESREMPYIKGQNEEVENTRDEVSYSSDTLSRCAQDKHLRCVRDKHPKDWETIDINNNRYNKNSNIIFSKENIVRTEQDCTPKIDVTLGTKAYSSDNSLFSCPITNIQKVKHTNKKESMFSKCKTMIDEYTSNEELREALFSYLNFRIERNREERKTNPNAFFYATNFKGLLNKLNTLASSDTDKITIVTNSLNGGWANFYEIKSPKWNNNYTHSNTSQTEYVKTFKAMDSESKSEYKNKQKAWREEMKKNGEQIEF